jgi:dipeptidyl aminopeptidase/acylaminoacyl peptidase
MITAADLVGLRDIGVPNALATDSPFGISPDGKQVAFVVAKADAAKNRYCLALMILTLAQGAQPRVLDEGGEPIRAVLDVRGLLVRQGYLRINQPLWSPDGHWIAYLRREQGVTQLWRLSADGRIREAVTYGRTDIDRFAWTPDSAALIITHAQEDEAQARVREHEALTGYAYDDRFVPSASSTPLTPASHMETCERIDLKREHVHFATAAECALIGAGFRADTAARAILQTNAGRRRAWTEQTDATRLQSPIILWASDEAGKAARCVYAACISTVEVGIEGLWWSQNGRDLLFLRREGWGASKTALYVWRPGPTPPRRLLSTDDLLMGCQMSRAGLLCARDASLHPRRLVVINPRTGSSSEMFDPNPEFKFLALGQVRRLLWRNTIGFECFGDLILPPGYKAGQRLPLLVVQYITRGFLRGGTGDEYPIQLFAARGYAVLSVQEPPSFYQSLPFGTWHDFSEAEFENMKDWRDRRSIFSSLVAGIRAAEKLRVVDPDRIGLTGLSDGATTAQFALVNSHLFAAAAISSCCVDAQPMMIYGGSRLARDRRAKGYGEATREGEAFNCPTRSFWEPLIASLRFKMPTSLCRFMFSRTRTTPNGSRRTAWPFTSEVSTGLTIG